MWGGPQRFVGTRWEQHPDVASTIAVGSNIPLRLISVWPANRPASVMVRQEHRTSHPRRASSPPFPASSPPFPTARPPLPLSPPRGARDARRHGGDARKSPGRVRRAITVAHAVQQRLPRLLSALTNSTVILEDDMRATTMPWPPPSPRSPARPGAPPPAVQRLPMAPPTAARQGIAPPPAALPPRPRWFSTTMKTTMTSTTLTGKATARSGLG